jgi:C4-type Zn-finger protein
VNNREPLQLTQQKSPDPDQCPATAPGRCMRMTGGQVIPFSKHYCPSCGRPMRFVLSVPTFGSFPELRTFECEICGVTYTEAAKADQAQPANPDIGAATDDDETLEKKA